MYQSFKIKIIYTFISIFVLVSLAACVDVASTDINEIRDVTIFFDTKVDSITIESVTGKPGTEVLVPELQTREGYIFSHWELNGFKYEITTFPNKSIIISAVWDKTFNIYFEVGNYHEPVMPIQMVKNQSLDDLPKLVYKIDDSGNGYKFTGWNFNDIELPFDKMPEMDIFLDAKWEEALVISFNTGLSEDYISPIFESSGTKVEAPNDHPKLHDYLFTGWTLNGAPYIFDEMPSKSIHLNASYIPTNEEYTSISSLPKMFINLDNNKLIDTVNRETYTNSNMTIHTTNEDNQLITKSLEFKGRGNGSWTDSGPKKGYRLKFFSKQSLFGQAKSKHWVLLAGANFYDPTLAKNPMAFNLARDIFDYIEYTTSTNWVELYINHEYRGVYMLAEHVRVDENRVNIESEFGVLDTGYLIEYDSYAAQDGPSGIYHFDISGYRYPFLVKRPDPDDFTDKGISESIYRSQVQFIKEYTTIVMHAALNKNLNLFMEYADIDSFIDMYLLHELFKNTDTGWSSFYMYKKPGGKLYAGPAWDFDATAGKNRGDTSPTGFYVSGSAQWESDFTSSELYISLMQIPMFKSLVSKRWKEISSNLKIYINEFLSEEFILEHKFAFGRNYERWSNLGPSYGLYPNQMSSEAQWGTAVRQLKNWLITRSNWFDTVFL